MDSLIWLIGYLPCSSLFRLSKAHCLRGNSSLHVPLSFNTTYYYGNDIIKCLITLSNLINNYYY